MRGKMNNKLTPEQTIEAINRWKMTPEERSIADAEKLGKEVGKAIASIMLLFLIPTIIWTVLIYLVGFEVTWLKVFGVYFIFNFIKNIIVNSFKN